MLVKTALRFDDDVKRLENHSQCCKQSHMIVIDSYCVCVCVSVSVNVCVFQFKDSCQRAAIKQILLTDFQTLAKLGKKWKLHTFPYCAVPFLSIFDENGTLGIKNTISINSINTKTSSACIQKCLLQASC